MELDIRMRIFLFFATSMKTKWIQLNYFFNFLIAISFGKKEIIIFN